MKRIIYGILSLIAVFSFVSCETEYLPPRVTYIVNNQSGHGLTVKYGSITKQISAGVADSIGSSEDGVPNIHEMMNAVVADSAFIIFDDGRVLSYYKSLELNEHKENYRVYAPSNGRNFLNKSDTCWQYRYVSDTPELMLRHFTFTVEEADYLRATMKRDNHD